VDLRVRLRLPREDRTKSSRVLISESGGRVIGLLVDAVSEVKKLAPESVESPPEMISAVGIEYITGVAKRADRLIIFLDIRKILNPEDMKQVNAMAGEKGTTVAA
jgi:purine-binding chemotaxis protein CheW